MNIVHFPDPKVHPQWRLLVEHFGDVGYDTLIRHDELTAAMEMKSLSEMSEKERLKYYNQVGIFRRFMLRDSNIYLETIPNQGYRAVMPNEHGRHALRKAEHGKRRYAQAVRITSHVDAKALSDKEVSELALIQTTIGGVHSMMKKEIRELRKVVALPKKKEQITLPGAVM